MKVRIVFVLGLILVFMVAGCADKGKEGAHRDRPAISGVTTMKVDTLEVDAYYETSGTVKAKTVSLVSSRTMGAVTSVKVKEGDSVRAGDLLLTIDDRDIVQKVKAAQAAVSEAQQARDTALQQRSLAEVTFKRYKNLYDEKVISQQEFDQIETQAKVADSAYKAAAQAVDRAGANLEEARSYFGYTQVRAPVSGVVSEKRIDAGSMAIPGVHLFTVEDVSRFKVEAAVDEGLAGKITVGTKVTVLFNKGTEKLTGTITKVVPSVDPSSRTFPIEVALSGPSLRTGLYGKVLIPRGKTTALLVPAGAVVEKGQLTGVFAVDGKGVVSYRLIKTGAARDNQFEVLSGLSRGETIIVSGVERAVDGGVIK